MGERVLLGKEKEPVKLEAKDDNPAIGIILCTDKDRTIIKYSNIKDKNLFVSKYKLYLPSKEELQKELANF